MIFSLRKNIIPIQNVYINNIVINYVTSTKFLGIIIDNKLTWCEHISHIKRKISKGIGILCQARKMLKLSTLHTLYYSFIFPYLNYCIQVWGSASKIHLDSICKL